MNFLVIGRKGFRPVHRANEERERERERSGSEKQEE